MCFFLCTKEKKLEVVRCCDMSTPEVAMARTYSNFCTDSPQGHWQVPYIIMGWALPEHSAVSVLSDKGLKTGGCAPPSCNCLGNLCSQDSDEPRDHINFISLSHKRNKINIKNKSKESNLIENLTQSKIKSCQLFNVFRFFVLFQITKWIHCINSSSGQT